MAIDTLEVGINNSESEIDEETREIFKRLSRYPKEIWDTGGTLAAGVDNEINNIISLRKFEIRCDGKYYSVPEDVIDSFLKDVESFGKEQFLLLKVDDKLYKELFGDDISFFKDNEVSYADVEPLFIPYYIKTLCPQGYLKVLQSLQPILNGYNSGTWNLNKKETPDTFGQIFDFIKKYGDKSADYFNYCLSNDGTYLKASLDSFIDRLITDDSVQNYKPLLKMAKLSYEEGSTVQFWEAFIDEPEGVNLFEYLKSNPQKLTNLGGRLIHEIDLNTEKGINFCFHGILAMVKSRDDLDFPHCVEDPTEDEKKEWKEKWDIIIKEYEKLLRSYIAEDFITDKNGERLEKPKEKTFDKIFYFRPIGDEIIDAYHTDIKMLQKYSSNPIDDFSYDCTDLERTSSAGINLYHKVKEYLEKNPYDKVLLCADIHGNPNGRSGDFWTKSDWLNLANLSSNLKIRSFRCFFGTAYERDSIHKHDSSLSGHSNNSVTSAQVNPIIADAFKEGLGFNEMEIYTRLNYMYSVAPLTESLLYSNKKTGKTTVGKVGLAYEDHLEKGDKFS